MDSGAISLLVSGYQTMVWGVQLPGFPPRSCTTERSPHATEVVLWGIYGSRY